MDGEQGCEGSPRKATASIRGCSLSVIWVVDGEQTGASLFVAREAVVAGVFQHLALMTLDACDRADASGRGLPSEGLDGAIP